MSSYRRFVTYVYRFAEGKKGSNCGFVKVEAKNEVCTFSFHLQGLKIQGSCQLMAFVRKGNDYDFLSIGQGTANGGLLSQRVDADRNHIGESSYTLEQCAGLLCTGENEEYYGTSWDQAENMPIWTRNPEPAAEPNPDARKKPEFEEARKPQEQQNPPTDRAHREEPKLREKPELQEEPEVQIEPEMREGLRMEPEAEPEMQERPEIEPEAEPEMRERFEIEPEAEPEMRERPEIEPEAEAEVRERLRMEPEMEKRPKLEPETESEMKAEEEPGPEEGPESASEPQMRKQEETVKSFEEIWAHMQEDFPCLEPFEDGGVVEGIKITPGDIPYLQEQKWNLGSNQFLLHGYKNYHHLLLGRVEGQNRYILGIPGVFDRQEQFMAKMFGFPCFKPVHACRSRMGQFGYWFRCIC